jgi:hypothetical protein
VVYFGGFFSQTGIFAGFSLYINNFAVVELSRVHRNPRAVLHFRGFFYKTGISLYNINFAERNSEAAMAGGGGIYFFGCRVAQLGGSSVALEDLS